MSRWLRTAPILFLSACGPRPNPSVVSRDSAGITIIANRLADRPLPWRFDTVATIGGPGSAVELGQLTENTVDADSMGRIYVLDAWFGHRVQLVDTMGKLLRVLTRHGQGPGEVDEGVSISASPDGVVSIMDFAKAGLVRVSATGEITPVLQLLGYSLFGGARAVADTVVVHTLDNRSPTLSERIQYRTATDSSTLAVHSPPRLGALSFCGSPMAGLTPMLTPELRWTARGSLVAISNTADYRIDVFRGQRLLRSLRRSVPARPGTVETVQRFFPEGKIVGSPYCAIPASELAATRGIAPVVQPIRRLAIDLDGRVWAERNTFPDEVAQTDVFDSAGVYVGTLTGVGAPLGFPTRTLIVVAPADSAIDPRLHVLRMIP